MNDLMVDIEIPAVVGHHRMNLSLREKPFYALDDIQQIHPIHPIVWKPSKRNTLRAEHLGRGKSGPSQHIEFMILPLFMAQRTTASRPLPKYQDMHLVAGISQPRHGTATPEDFIVGMGTNDTYLICHH
ncbi:MAG: hypothetical protein NTNFB01_25140 [Nitrospira sp.]|jgi:hypothetical protein